MEHLSTPDRRRNAEGLSLDAPVATDAPLIDPRLFVRPDEVIPKTRELERASAAWMSLVFGLCYVALPWIADATGLYRGLLDGIAGNFMGFLATAATTIGVIALSRPTVRLGRKMRRDPVIAATFGSLVVWAVLHNTVAGLMPFNDMGVVGFLTFFLMNAIESTLFGVMLASFARNVPAAIALGAGFQALFFLTAGLARGLLW
jgi:hypothetical protein